MSAETRGDRLIRFIETLRVPEGMHQGNPLVLRPWQRAILKGVYDPVTPAGIRLVRKGIYSVAKKQGKTPLVASIGLGHLIGPEAKQNEQLYSAAYDRDQAAITFRYMRQMVEMDEELSDLLIVRESRKEIACPGNGSLFKALSSDVRGKHGLGPALLILDELAQFGADRAFYDTLIQGRGAHVEPLVWIISTQAADDLAVLSQEIDYGLKVESGEFKDPTVRCFLFTTPPEADPFAEESWAASNPALGDFLNIEDMREAARTAKNMPSAEANFRNLRLNQRIDAAAHFIAPAVWKACAGPVDFDLFESVPVYAGLDLSAKNDLTALVLVAQALRCADGAHQVYEDAWHVWPLFWTPGDNLRERQDRDRAPYCLWRDQGFLEPKPGLTIDYGWVARKIAELHGRMNIAAIKFDRWKIGDLVRELVAAGVDAWIEGVDEPVAGGLRLIAHGQGFRDMNPAVEVVEDLLTEGKVRHGGHPVLTWCASNTRVQSDPAGNRKFDKIKSTGRIDGLVAMAMALNGAVSAVPVPPTGDAGMELWD